MVTLCLYNEDHWVRLVLTEGRAPVYVDRTVEVMGLESIFEEAAWNGSEV